MQDIHSIWLDASRETITSYRRLIDGIVNQLDDEAFFRKPDSEQNSIANIIRHLGGNLDSRWTDFLTTDGEKPDRNRETEFAKWDGDRESLMNYFDRGWRRLESAVDQLTNEMILDPIEIRGEPHSIPLALHRSIAHIAYHVGQMMIIARSVHQGEWTWLTIAPGNSGEHNAKTWGSPSSRGTMGGDDFLADDNGQRR